MRNGKILFAAIAISLFMAGDICAWEARHGTIVELTPIDNRGDDETEITKKKRKFGNLMGQLAGQAMVAKGGTARMVADGAPGTGELIATRIGPDGPAAHYMVKLKIDGGKTLAVTQRRRDLDDLHVGSRVSILGTGEDIQLRPE
jgi:outer membrane lipoprotein SlyB